MALLTDIETHIGALAALASIPIGLVLIIYARRLDNYIRNQMSKEATVKPIDGHRLLSLNNWRVLAVYFIASLCFLWVSYYILSKPTEIVGPPGMRGPVGPQGPPGQPANDAQVADLVTRMQTLERMQKLEFCKDTLQNVVSQANLSEVIKSIEGEIVNPPPIVSMMSPRARWMGILSAINGTPRKTCHNPFSEWTL